MSVLIATTLILVASDRPVDAFRPREQFYADAPYCGIYAVYAAASALGVERAFKDLLQPRFVGSAAGSTASDLLAACEEIGIDATPLNDANLTTLQMADSPMILHLRLPGKGALYQHWVVYLGSEDGKARILDTINATQLLPFAEVLAHWDGKAIVCGQKSQNWTWMGVGALAPYLPWLAAIGVPLLAARRLRPTLERRRVLTLALLGTTATTVAAANAWFGPLGFFRNPGAVGAVVAHDFVPDVPIVSTAELRLAIDDPMTVVVDARSPSAYERFHLPNALNLPVGASLADRIEFARLADRRARIVVYCQSTQCTWADAVSADLYFRGFHSVAIYRGGVNEWKSRPRNK